MVNTQVTIFSGRKPHQYTNGKVKKKSHQDTVSFQLVKKKCGKKTGRKYTKVLTVTICGWVGFPNMHCDNTSIVRKHNSTAVLTKGIFNTNDQRQVSQDTSFPIF